VLTVKVLFHQQKHRNVHRTKDIVIPDMAVSGCRVGYDQKKVRPTSYLQYTCRSAETRHNTRPITDYNHRSHVFRLLVNGSTAMRFCPANV